MSPRPSPEKSEAQRERMRRRFAGTTPDERRAATAAATAASAATRRAIAQKGRTQVAVDKLLAVAPALTARQRDQLREMLGPYSSDAASEAS